MHHHHRSHHLKILEMYFLERKVYYFCRAFALPLEELERIDCFLRKSERKNTAKSEERKGIKRMRADTLAREPPLRRRLRARTLFAQLCLIKKGSSSIQQESGCSASRAVSALQVNAMSQSSDLDAFAFESIWTAFESTQV